MAGLQEKRIGRSKLASGHSIIFIADQKHSLALEVQEFLKSKKIDSFVEHEIELLLKNENYIAPVVVHGIDTSHPPPPFLQGLIIKEGILSNMLALKVNLSLGEKFRLISPAHTNIIFGDIPRTATLYVSDTISTNVPEIDYYHLWVPLKVLQNLMRKRDANKIRIFNEVDTDLLKEELEEKFSDSVYLKTWEEMNSTLVWALGLENTVMIFLFVAMTFLVSLCITSGLLIFFGKIKGDLASFWILGTSKKELEKGVAIFLSLMSVGAVTIGIIAGIIALKTLESYGVNIMPEEFVDRQLAVRITGQGIFISFVVPTLISMGFCFLTFSQFKRDTNYLEYVRTVG